jgi:hypothetical protein
MSDDKESAERKVASKTKLSGNWTRIMACRTQSSNQMLLTMRNISSTPSNLLQQKETRNYMHVQTSEKSSVLRWKVSWFRRFSLTFVMCALLAACSCSRIFLVFRYISTATDHVVKKWGHTVQLSNAESWIKQWTNRQKWRERKKALTNRIYLLFC